MKYHVRLSRQMRNLQITLMVCVLIVGFAGAVYGVLAAGNGFWHFWKPAGYVFAGIVLLIAFGIAWNGYREVTTRVVVYPGRKIIVHKGSSVRVYRFDELQKPKPAKRNRRVEDDEEDPDENQNNYGLSMVLRQKNGRKIVKLSTSFKYVKRLEEDLCRYL